MIKINFTDASPVNCKNFGGKYFVAQQVTKYLHEDMLACKSLNAELANETTFESKDLQKFLTRCSIQLLKQNIGTVKFSAQNTSTYHVVRAVYDPGLFQIRTFNSLKETVGNPLCKTIEKPQSFLSFYLLIIIGGLFVAFTVMSVMLLYKQKVCDFTIIVQTLVLKNTMS